MNIKTIKDFEKYIASGSHQAPADCPIYFIMADGGRISYATAVENAERIKDEIENGDFLGWQAIGCDVNWGFELYCDHSGERIKSAVEAEEIG